MPEIVDQSALGAKKVVSSWSERSVRYMSAVLSSWKVYAFVLNLDLKVVAFASEVMLLEPPEPPPPRMALHPMSIVDDASRASNPSLVIWAVERAGRQSDVGMIFMHRA